MKKPGIFLILVCLLPHFASAQQTQQEFDSVLFTKNLAFAYWLSEYEYYQLLTINELAQQPENASLEWFSYFENKTWHTVGYSYPGELLTVSRHVTMDSVSGIVDYTGATDTGFLMASALAHANANKHFQLIRDTSNLYFNSFVRSNPDQTISIWYFPAFQPSGQAVYGAEWEYTYDKSGKNLLHIKTQINKITALWIGQPRELWLNYRNSDQPTAGSLFFALSFRDYFTRIRIDTRLSISTTSKDNEGNYTWTHKMK